MGLCLPLLLPAVRLVAVLLSVRLRVPFMAANIMIAGKLMCKEFELHNDSEKWRNENKTCCMTTEVMCVHVVGDMWRLLQGNCDVAGGVIVWVCVGACVPKETNLQK